MANNNKTEGNDREEDEADAITVKGDDISTDEV